MDVDLELSELIRRGWLSTLKERCRYGDLPLLKELVRRGVDPKTVRDSEGSTPLHIACRYVPLWSSITHSDSPLS